MSDQDMAVETPRGRRAALGFVFVCVLLDMMALGIIVPVLPRLIQDFSGGAASAARWIGWFVAAWTLMQFFASPILGGLSDTEVFARAIGSWSQWAPVGAAFYLASGLMTLGLVLALGLPAESRTADITADA